MRIFLDTNVLASALGTRGLCSELLEAILGSHELLTSDAVLLELERTLTDKFRLPRSTIHGYVALLRTAGQVTAPASTPITSIKDSADAEIVACAIAAKADVFVTGDKALLKLGSIRKLPVRSPRQLWRQFAGLEGAEELK